MSRIPPGGANLRCELLLVILRQALAVGDHEGVDRLVVAFSAAARMLAEQKHYAAQMHALVTCLADAGEVRRAIEATRLILSSAIQGGTLADLAKRLVADEPADRVRSLVAEVLTTRGWLAAVVLVGRLEPRVLKDFADLISRAPAG